MQEVTGSIPVFSTRKKSTTQKCVVLFFVKANRVRENPFRLAASRQATFPKGTAFVAVVNFPI